MAFNTHPLFFIVVFIDIVKLNPSTNNLIKYFDHRYSPNATRQEDNKLCNTSTSISLRYSLQTINSKVQFAVYGADLIYAPLKITQDGHLSLILCGFNYKYSLHYANLNDMDNPNVNPMSNCV